MLSRIHGGWWIGEVNAERISIADFELAKGATIPNTFFKKIDN